MILRVRRYRVYVIIAVAFLYGFYYLKSRPQPPSRSPSSRRTTYTPQAEDALPIPDVDRRPRRSSGKRTRKQKHPANVNEPQKPLQKDNEGFPQLELPGVDEARAPIPESRAVGKTNKYPNHPSKGNKNTRSAFQPGKHKAERLTGEALEALNKDRVYWFHQPEHFPVPTSDLIPLPSGKPEVIPKIQATFHNELITQRRIREKKLNAIKDTFQKHWDSYRDCAWEHDELKPVSGGFRDPLAGWRSTLVDTLDTLWIMGLKDQFEEALVEVKTINFKTTLRVALPLFEVTIRYLGGLLGAYDVSGQKYEVLLSKARELAEVLMGAFDTPNRMPIGTYRWQPSEAKHKRVADMVTLSELGSMSLEFTRLAQITKDSKYYDAVARITNELDAWQSTTKLPGMWPLKIDATGGCVFDELQKGHSASKGPRIDKREVPAVVEGHDSHTRKANAALNACVTRGLASFRGETSIDMFSIAGSADSAYECLPKEYVLLGGLGKQYEKMHNASVKTLSDYLLYQPMIENEQRKVLFTGEFATTGVRDKETGRMQGTFKSTTTHLSCFAGAWIGLGARIFNRPQDLDMAARLADGCVWAYEQTSTEIMPESLDLVPCPALNEPCPWNQTRWWEAIDPEATRKAGKQATGAQHHDAPEQDTSFGRMHPDAHDNPLRKRELESGNGAGIAPHVSEEIDANKGKKARFEEGGSRLRSQKAIQDKDSAKPKTPITSDAAPPTYTEQMSERIAKDHLKPGIARINQREYLLRPEALESAFVLWRISGDIKWREKGWTMFEAINAATETEFGNSAIWDVTDDEPRFRDNAESFWTAETLKYAYLLFSDPEHVSLDDYVFNTEGHPFRRPDARKYPQAQVDFKDGIGM